MIIDSHVNLHSEQFNQDLQDVLKRAADAGVDGMLTICDRLENWPAVQRIARMQRNIWCSVGVHPHYAKHHAQLQAATLIEFANTESKIVGIGECGLDLYYAHSPIEDQIPVLRAHIKAARELGIPVILHTRDADAQMASLLEQEWKAGPFSMLLHCYTAGAELAVRASAMGAYFSISGIATFKAADDVRAIVKTLPLDRLIVETDCPYLAPVPHRGRRNEPAYVKEVLECVASLRNLSSGEAMELTTNNFFRLFKRAAMSQTR